MTGQKIREPKKGGVNLKTKIAIKRKAIMVPVMLSLVCLGGCAQYDVLDQVIDTTQESEESSETGDGSEEVVHIDLSDEESSVSSDAGARPEYQASEYVDTSACKIPDLTVTDTTDEAALEAIHELMMEQEVYSEAEKAGHGDIVNIDYTATEIGSDSPYVDVKDQDTYVDDTVFPKQVKKRFIGAKAGSHFVVRYAFPEDLSDEDYKGKTFVYDITVNSVKGMALTDQVAYELSAGAAATEQDYMDYVKSVLRIQKQEQVLESALEELLSQCVIKKFPEDVLEYDAQAAMIAAYEDAGVSDVESFETEVAQALGFEGMDDYLDALIADVKNSLEQEIKILALADKYGVDTEDADLTELREEIKERLGDEKK